MYTKKNAFVSVISVIVAFAFAFIFTACGGECDSATEDCTDYPTDNTPADDSIVTSDNDSAQPDDVVQDNEPTDADTTPVVCSEDQNCQEVCKNFLDRAGHWNRVESDMDPGSIDVVLSVENEQCRITLTGSKRYTWIGLNYPLEPFAPGGYFFYLQKTDSETFVVEQKQEKDGEIIGLMTFVR